MGDEIVDTSFLLFGQFTKLQSETAKLGGHERGPGKDVPYPNQTHRNVLQVEILVSHEDIHGHVLGKNILEKDGLNLHSARTDIQDGKGDVVDEGKGTIADLKAWMLPPFLVTSHVFP
jgi:hypothetical protein